MTLEPGRQLLHYRLVSELGAGAMGQVWRAVDDSLGRDVAVKVLPSELAHDPDRLARFGREARLLAAINHPNVATVHGLHEADGVPFLVMELVPGETLAERIAASPGRSLPLDDVLAIGRQIAEALETAHEAGVVHRDLKPGNVMVRPDGTVKVLDFGLARDVRGGPLSGSDPEAPTATAEETAVGAVVGTLLYMSPEQARGGPVDRRTDIWALGCLLYECLVGRRPFCGESAADVVAAILSSTPDLDALPPSTPGGLRRLVGRCLVKDPRRRLRDAGEARITLAELADGVDADQPPAQRDSRRPWHRRAAPAWTIAAFALAIAVVSAWQREAAAPASPAAEPSEWSIALPPGTRIHMPGPGGRFDFSRLVALSRDGRRIAYAVQDADGRVDLHLRDQRSAEARPIPGTAEARGPFFSPDGQWLAFYSDAALRKVSLSGGSPQRLAELGRMISFDGDWSPDGRTIVYATDLGLWSVSADGGTPTRLTTPDPEAGEAGHYAPRFSADGASVLFTVTHTPDRHLARLDLETGGWEIVIRDAAQGIPLGDGRIVFARGAELLVATWDDTRGTAGTSLPVIEGVHVAPGLGGMLISQFDVSTTGTLAFVPAPSESDDDRLLWVDRRGREEEVTRGPGTWVHPRLSPDGRRISVDIHSADGMRDVYVYELERRQLNRLTTTGVSWESEWRPPDGRRLALLSGAPPGQWSLFWVTTDFSSPPELLFRSGHAVPLSWLPDGMSFLFSKHRFDGGLWRLWVERAREPESILATAARERFGRVSIDGRWLTYVADEAGRGEVFVRSFPELGMRTRISDGGGGEPRFSRSGDELFFRRRNAMYRVPLALGDPIVVGEPELLFEGDYDFAAVGHQHYDLSLDDSRFLMIRHGETSGPDEVRVVLDWASGLDGRR